MTFKKKKKERKTTNVWENHRVKARASPAKGSQVTSRWWVGGSGVWKEGREERKVSGAQHQTETTWGRASTQESASSSRPKGLAASAFPRLVYWLLAPRNNIPS